MKIQSIGSNQTEVSLADGTEILFSYSTPVAALVTMGTDPPHPHCDSRRTAHYR